MNGLLLINKPIGITSFDIIRVLRPRLGVRKIGHSGTLDPLASGLMLMLLGTATKQAAELTKQDKTYVAHITLGATSTTGDGEGEKTAVSSDVPSLAQVQAVAEQFTGPLQQVPSAYSAIKIDGKEAYKRVRAGETVTMPGREIIIYSNTVLSYSYPHIEIEATVSSGTYIRSLAEDMGAQLGTGAYLSGLVRLQVGDYRLEDALVLDEVTLASAQQHLRDI